MSYVWSSPVSISVIEELKIVKVEVIPSKTTAYVGESINFRVRVTFNRTTTSYDVGYYITTVLAVNTQGNIVSMWSEYLSPNISTYEYTHTYKFTSPGTYTVWGGGKLGVSAYSYGYPIFSEPIIIQVGYGYEGYPSPGLLGDVALFTLGFIAGVLTYKSYVEGKLRIPKVVITK